MGVAGIDPMSTDALEEIDRAVDMGFVGVTVCPSDQGFHPTNSTAMRVWERCQHLGFPIFVSRPGPPCPGAILEFDRPLNWDEVARSIPELPIVLGGIGTPWVEETLLLLQKHPRIFADTAGLIRRPWHLFQALLGASSMGVTDKVLFASGWPVETPSKAIETIYSVNSFSQAPSCPRSSTASSRSSSGISRPCSACPSPRRSPTRSRAPSRCPRARPESSMKRAFAGILAIATSVLPLVAGCAPTGPEGRLALTSRTANPLRLDASFAHGSYAVDPRACRSSCRRFRWMP